MKNTKSQETIAMIQEFEVMKAKAKELDAAMKVIRESLIGLMGDEKSMKAGEFLLILSERIRTDIDKKSLEADLGDEVKKYEKKVSYKVLDVKQA